MAIPQHHMNNFNTLQRAFAQGQVALVECKDERNGEIVYAIAAVQQSSIIVPGQDPEVEIIPFAQMFNDNPFEFLAPPDSEQPTGFKALDLEL
jgi:hypothetical protein